MEIFGLEIEDGVVAGTLLIWLVIVALTWFGASVLGLKDWAVFQKIIITIASLPLCYFIVNFVANK